MDVKRLTGTAVAAVACAWCALPAGAAAAAAPAPNCSAQTGVSALDQYCTSLPSADGQPQPAGPDQKPAGPPLSATLPPSERRQLQASGPAARALLTVTAGRPASPGSSGRQGAPAVSAAVERSSKPADPPAAVHALASAAPDVLEGAFRWGLVASTVGIFGLAWLRWRARPRP